MNFFNATKKAAAMLGVAVGVVFAQEVDTAYVPFRVNVDATIRAEYKNGTTVVASAQITALADVDVTLAVPLPEGTAVLLPGSQRRAALPVVSANGGGKVALNLPAQSYKNATVALYGLNGKRVLGAKFSASQSVNSVSRRDVVAGVYLLSIKGADADASVTSRVTHSGGNLEISAVFGGGDLAAVPQMAKKAADGAWNITVKATETGYVDSVYTLKLASGINPKQNITLRVPVVNNCTSAATCKAVTIGTQVWMAENLNIETVDSWCYENSGDSCRKYGRLYTWEAAKTACPIGWYLPRRDEWGTLAKFAGGTGTYGDEGSAGKALKSKTGWDDYSKGTDAHGFSALPGGYYANGEFYLAGRGGKWWTDTEDSDGNAYYRSADNNLGEGYSGKSYNRYRREGYGNSVRCVGGGADDITYTVTVNRNPAVGGTTVPASSQSNIRAGSQVNLTATASDGYEFSGWTVTSGVGTIAAANNASTSVTVNGNVTVTANFAQKDSTLSYGDQTYKTVLIGGQTWMAENLNFATSSGSWCYGNDNSNCNKYGRLYNWATAKTVCPTGWHLPSREDWGTLAKSVGGGGTYGAQGATAYMLKSRTGWTGTGNGGDVYKFSALPGGRRVYPENSFSDVGNHGYWWTATEDNSGSAYYRGMGYNYDNVSEIFIDKGYGLSVRCLRN